MARRFVAFASYGNDSIAMLQWAREQGLQDLTALYSDTGWASDDWAARVEHSEAWARSLGFQCARTASIGLEALVKEKKGWPRQGIQFCTVRLKIEPALEWLDAHDPDKQATCMVGVRREESANRRSFPEHMEVSPNHGDRALWAPLVSFTEEQRNELLARAGFEPLPHRSMEYFPCINSNRRDLRQLAEDASRIEHIARIEDELGFTSKGKPRTMFRPYRYMGATGIHEIVRWAQSERGEFSTDDGTGATCESGFCAT